MNSRTTLKNICTELNLQDVSEVLPAIKKMSTVVEVVPRMEHFIEEVCKIVKEAEGKNAKLPSVTETLPKLRTWPGQLAELRVLQVHQKPNWIVIICVRIWILFYFRIHYEYVVVT